MQYNLHVTQLILNVRPTLQWMALSEVVGAKFRRLSKQGFESDRSTLTWCSDDTLSPINHWYAWHSWIARVQHWTQMRTQPMISTKGWGLLYHDTFSQKKWKPKRFDEFLAKSKKITASSSRAGARVPYALSMLPERSQEGGNRQRWCSGRYLTRSQPERSEEPLSQTIFSRTET